MPPITVTHTFAKPFNSKRSLQQKGWIATFKNFARILDSRESTYRTGLDIVAFDIPTMGAAAFRNFWNFLEATLECALGTISVITAPYVTAFVGNLFGKFIMPKAENNNISNHLRFAMSELENEQSFIHGIERIEKEEPKDQERISTLHAEMGDIETARKYHNKANEIRRYCLTMKEFCRKHKGTTKLKEMMQNIYKLKRSTILGESFIEGGIWGSFGLTIRAFRKYVLKQERFTGTKGYLSDVESQSIGEGGELNWFQRIAGTFTIFLSPILNAIALAKTKDKNKVKSSQFLSIVDSQLDMTHGVFPKLGLLFSYTSVPKWIGILFTSQGWYERIERLMKLCTVLPSWWMGHRLTNGLIGLRYDNYLAKKYNIKTGILIEPDCRKPENKNGTFFDRFNYYLPEPARIHHVLDRVEGEKSLGDKQKEELINEAKDLHSKTLYGGFALHSFLVWVVNMLVNQITKIRALKAAGR